MRRILLASWASVAIAGCGGDAPPPVAPSPPPPPVVSAAPEAQPPSAAARWGYPATTKEEVRDTVHGITFNDPYRWLEDGKSPKVRDWLSAQDAYARAYLAKQPGRDALVARLKELAYTARAGEPRKYGKRYFATRREEREEKDVVVVREGKTGTDKVLLDPLAWAKDGTSSLRAWRPSWDGTKVAYTKSENAADHAVLYVRDVATGQDSKTDVIEGCRYASPSWNAKGDGFYYVRISMDPSVSEADRPGTQEVRFHKLGTDPKTDPIIRPASRDSTRFLYAQASKDGHWLITTSGNYVENEITFKDLRVKDAPFQSLATKKDTKYDLDIYKDAFYLTTNEDAPNYHVFAIDPKKPSRDAWKEIVAERKDATLTAGRVVGKSLALRYLKDVLTELEIHALDGKPLRTVALPGPGTASAFVGDEDDDEAYYTFQSFTNAPEIFETSVKSGKTSSYFKTKVAADLSKYTVEPRFARSKDGTKVPYFIVHTTSFKKGDAAPTMLTAYGGFNVSVTPTFTGTRIAWLEKGGVFVQASLRGGGEYGESWHRAGMLAKKQNVFDDFLAVAEDLVHEGYTKPERLGIAGGSNGGLLVGAAMVQKPELFGAVACAVPLLDMVRYTQVGSGKTWVSEYGSADDPAQFRTLLAYSPYHHVRSGTKYPALLMDSADSDDRVDPMHARKFVAAIQDASVGGPTILRVERNAGHGGADLVKQAVERTADQYAFFLSVLKP